ncbi:MAG: FeS assembly protein SufD [Cyanobacteriota bacterium]|jgi:Fe-S cluster assembly protein SufD
MIQVSEKKQVTYLAQLLECVSATSNSGVEWLKDVRQSAKALVQELEIPTTRDEEWRFTNLAPLLDVKFQVGNAPELSPFSVNLLTLPEANESRLVFVNGVFSPQFSAIKNLPEGIFVGNLLGSDSLNQGGISSEKISKYLAKQQGGQEVFTALNTAALNDVAVVWVSKNVVVETPIHLLFISLAGETSLITQPRCLIVAEPGSAVTIVEHYGTAEPGCPDSRKAHVYFNNAVTEIWVEENAQVNHTRVQRDAGDAFHIGKTAVSQSRNSRYTCHSVSLGASLSRHNLDIFQTGESTETTLNGLTLIGGEQLADTHSAIALNYPHSVTRQLNKCIVDDKSHGVFNGKIFVRKGAQLTDAGQLSRNLLMSSKARVDTKPQLEIIADNVKCSHGATVSQLNEDEMFYLQSRGLDVDTSRHLLIDGFAGEILSKLPLDSLRQMLARCVSCRT